MALARIYQRMSEFVMGIKSSSSANTALPRDYLVRYEDPQANYDIHMDYNPVKQALMAYTDVVLMLFPPSLI